MIAFGWLLVGHVLADFPLQGDFLAKAKNHNAGIPGVPWLPCLIAHAVICAGAVALVLPWPYAVLEFMVHLPVDFWKNEGALGTGERAFVIDQALHVASKVVWASMAAAGVSL